MLFCFLIYKNNYNATDIVLLFTKKSMRKALWTALSVFGVLAIAGCSGIKEWPIQSWDIVYVSYTATYREDGDVFEKVEEPIPVSVGSAEILSKIDDELLGMQKGETKNIIVTPKDGFGNEYDNDLVKVIPAMYLTVAWTDVAMGSIVSLDGRDGVIIGVQGEGDDARVTVDLNPSYTWKDLEFALMVHQIGGKSLQEENK